jgi:flagellar basal body-associated protein FliL
MPRREENTTQTSKNPWWVPVLIGVLLLMVPGGVFVAPIFFLLAIVARRKNKPKESPETPPLPLINITPNPHS